MSASSYDVVIVGAGAGGGVIAGVLAEAGKRVLLLERGEDLSAPGAVGRDHLRNQRLSQYANNAGPDGPDHPRVLVDWKSGNWRAVLPHEGGYGNNAATVGGGTRVYGGQAWRFHPLDFRMASTYGVPDGSSLADWPVSYDDLAPYYERAEWEVGVSGDAAAMAAAGFLPPFARDYPMPPVTPDTLQGRAFRAGAAALGWPTAPVPLLVNSRPYLGRAACAHCNMCVGFACPTDGKNGTQNTLIPRALVSGRCTLETGATAERIDVEGGRAVGVTYRDRAGERRTVRAEVVVAAGGAIETARLLLLSGLGNDHVGRHLQGHYYPVALARFEQDIYDGVGPGASTATCAFNHGNEGIVGGGMLADDFVALPITAWKRHADPAVPRWGAEAKAWMRDHYRRVTEVKGPVQEIPSPDARVTLDPEVRDKWGLPVARLSGATHPETVRTAAYMWDRAAEWARAAGAVQVWGAPPGLSLSSGQHQAGTVRMGDDPAASAADRFCRLHGHDNLYIGDGSVHVTNGGFNPVLTIMALAFRTADHIAKNW
jgi:choline dehydrogenase-like flavoprotein